MSDASSSCGLNSGETAYDDGPVERFSSRAFQVGEVGVESRRLLAALRSTIHCSR